LVDLDAERFFAVVDFGVRLRPEAGFRRVVVFFDLLLEDLLAMAWLF